MTLFRFQLYPILLLLLPLLFKPILAFPLHKIPRLTANYKEAFISRNPNNDNSPPTISKDYKKYFYTQTLDHFNYGPQSYATFKQKYVVNAKYWGGGKSNAPILAYLGEESPLDVDLDFIGFLPDNAPYFNALSVYIEHRFYGESIPFGSSDEAMNNSTTRGYFNSAQALADYAEVLLHVKEKFSAHYSPIIVIGGSYGGMLASWFRLKYPHIALGAMASSAPILYFDNITPQNGYYSVVTNDFKEVSKSCYQTIRKSPLKNSSKLKDFLDSMYSTAAQYNHPPKYPVTMVCGGVDGAPKGTDIIGRIFAGVVSYIGNYTCYDMDMYNQPTSETSVGWSWQTCSEMVMPIGRGENDTMFPALPFDLQQFIEDCKSSYGVPPRPHWVTTYYGGHDIKLILNRFGSNIIFSNGLRDPYSSAGVLEDLSESIVAITTHNGSHCLDLHPVRKTDPEWLVMQRNIELTIIEGWITKYYADLHALKK
ncbi:hypothetical protein BUALT_Bualt13G0066700 [Buddleja alternifolia]|uniref:Lysosomal Pro-X carboxypeptidase n=1 Tax=Buddleja alternifolia TaxID=168488 RepID=A0AAV6WT01_9LAMI|nr:hypothetical protein BUALT_Bualt13G0066700 [Buddleja alternifolia]